MFRKKYQKLSFYIYLKSIMYDFVNILENNKNLHISCIVFYFITYNLLLSSFSIEYAGFFPLFHLMKYFCLSSNIKFEFLSVLEHKETFTFLSVLQNGYKIWPFCQSFKMSINFDIFVCPSKWVSWVRAPVGSNQNCKIGICCFTTKHAALRSKNKD